MRSVIQTPYGFLHIVTLSATQSLFFFIFVAWVIFSFSFKRLQTQHLNMSMSEMHPFCWTFSRDHALIFSCDVKWVGLHGIGFFLTVNLVWHHIFYTLLWSKHKEWGSTLVGISLNFIRIYCLLCHLVPNVKNIDFFPLLLFIILLSTNDN